MNFIYIFLHFFIKNNRLQVLKSILIRKWVIQLGAPKYLFVDIIKTIIKIGVVFFLIPFSLKKIKTKTIILNGGSNKKAKQLRHYFIKKFTSNKSITFFELGVKTNYFYDALSFSKIFKLIKLTILIQIALLTQITKKSTVSINWIFNLYQFIIQLILIEKSQTKVYFFILYQMDVYLASLIASEWLDIDINVVASNSLLYNNNRYTYLPNASLIYCSVIQEDEIEMYRNNEWVKVKSKSFWGLEESLYYDKIKKQSPSYDIGIYSAGGWARKSNFLRNPLKSIKENGSEANLLSDIFENIIFSAIKELKQQFPHLKIIIFPHPHERNLIQRGIEPNYLKELNALSIDFDDSPRDSINKIYEAKIGVTSLSTIIFDRLNYELKGFVFSGKGCHDFNINPKYLGRYAKMCYDDKDDLKDKVIKELNLT
jgi:hypothetical protein